MHLIWPQTASLPAITTQLLSYCHYIITKGHQTDSFIAYSVCSSDSPWEQTFFGTAWSSVLDWIVPGSQFFTSDVSWSVAAGVHKVFSLCLRAKVTIELVKVDIISCSVTFCRRSLLSRVKGTSAPRPQIDVAWGINKYIFDWYNKMSYWLCTWHYILWSPEAVLSVEILTCLTLPDVFAMA